MTSFTAIYYWDVLIQTYVFGMYTVLFSIAVYLLLAERERSKSNIILLSPVLILYTSSATFFMLGVVTTSSTLLRDSKSLEVVENLSATTHIVQLVCEATNCVIGDLVVIWRAWVVWERKPYILCISLCLLAGTAFTAYALPYEIAKFSAESQVIYGAFSNFSFAFGALTLTTNLWVTALFAYRAWSHYRYVQRMVGSRFHSRTRPLLVLVECGSFYCVAWVSHFYALDGDARSSTDDDHHPWQITQIVLLAVRSRAVYVVNGVLPQLIGIYPTLIIILVCLKLTHQDAVTEFKTSQLLQHVEFSAPP
ncbi:hypothetical protein EVG20_g2298 [Dentipellis fragilis]|uniref:G-protein coupled receptors family 1 profile domain-containing protein n=1 Tax=Dentipellis fragilis TaxID=205917 RepID=A0A4Y9ZA98_9AGAM|nr:hypothetical protein EVG20_g2298 [Dentipellis fragilis]